MAIVRIKIEEASEGVLVMFGTAWDGPDHLNPYFALLRLRGWEVGTDTPSDVLVIYDDFVSVPLEGSA